METLPSDPDRWPRSAKDIVKHLRVDGPLTNKDLVERTGLARRTLGRTLRRLLDAGFLERQPSLRDTRRFYYSLDHLPSRT